MICQICNKEIKGALALPSHLRLHNLNVQSYYDKYYKKENEGICIDCGQPTQFISFTKGYKNKCNICNNFKNKPLYKCLICGYTGARLKTHILAKHQISDKDYYDKYLKKKNDGKCFTCGKELNFLSIHKGYRKFCNSSCAQLYEEVQNKRCNTMIDRYGAKTTLESSILKNKVKQTNIKKYGVDEYVKSNKYKEKFKQTSLEHFGTEHPWSNTQIRNKIKNTFLEKYGVDNPNKSIKIKEKIKQTCKEKYGYDYISQVPEFIKLNHDNQRKKHNGKLAWNTEKQKETNLKNQQISNKIDLNKL